MAHWMAVGGEDNWRHTLGGRNIWGVASRYTKVWGEIEVGDLIFFYVTRAVRGMVGFGRVTSKAEEHIPFWPQETEHGDVLWPLRVTFDVEALLQTKKWNTDKVDFEGKGLAWRGAIQSIPEDLGHLIKEEIRRAVS